MIVRIVVPILILFFNFQLSAFSNGIITKDTLTTLEASQRIGETILMKGKVVSISKRSSKADHPLIYINLDYAYPKNTITVVIVGKNVPKFNFNEEEYLNREVLVKGMVVKNKGYKPTIFFNEQSQLKLSKSQI